MESVALEPELNPREVRDLAPISYSETSRLYRLRIEGKSHLLKWSLEEDPLEPKAYELLRELRVPELPVCISAPSALLLEDVKASPIWTLAGEWDVEGRAVGQAVAERYQFLRIAERSLVRGGAPDWLR